MTVAAVMSHTKNPAWSMRGFCQPIEGLLASGDIYVVTDYATQNGSCDSADDGALELVPAGDCSDCRTSGGADGCITLGVLHPRCAPSGSGVRTGGTTG